MASLSIPWRMTLATMALFATTLLAPPLLAQESQAEEPWQAVINSQIQAFRDRDAAAAFDYAGVAYQISFPSAEMFFEVIMRAGYAPIMDSHSHRFGGFRKFGDRAVIQHVSLLGSNQQMYWAVYQVTEEPAGWRVQGVQLVGRTGMAI
jgi:hypothetical protein